MKIVYCLPDTYKPGGIERVVSLKASYLADVMGYDVTIITTGQGNKEPYYHFSQRITFIDLDLNYDETLTLPFVKRLKVRHQKRKLHKQKLADVLNKIKADVVISTLTHEVDFLPKIKDGSRKVLEFHFFKGHKRVYANSFGFPFHAKLAYYYRAFCEEKFIVSKYDKFVVLTEEDKQQWGKALKNITVIPNPLPFLPETSSSLKEKKVIAVGRLDAQKGFDRLILLWRKIKNKLPQWQLHIYGQGGDEDKLRSLIKENNLTEQVFIYPPEKDIEARYLESSILALTSRYEGFGMILVEAMACGLPCVAYACKCGPRDIIEDQVDGYCIDNGDEDAFVEQIIKLMQDDSERIRMGNNAKENIKRLKVENVMEKWDLLFKSLIK